MANGDTKSYDDDHEAFAGSRVSQYVYVPTRESFSEALDAHADTLEGDVKPPLVVLGEEGSGKTALFANWLTKRREHRHRDEFLFQHYVGCSTESFQLSQMLFRLETALKVFFQLREMIVPETEVELRWSLSRFLAAAAKKYSPARIVIIIDGVNRLKCEGAMDGALHWLPIDLPPCVRLMVSTVEFDRQMPRSTRTHKHSTFVELSRRNYPVLKIEALGMQIRHSVISDFSAMYPGALDLEQSQTYKIATANATAQPQFLRFLLQSLKLACSMSSYSLDELIDMFLPCQSAYDLIKKNFQICFEDDSADNATLSSSVVSNANDEASGKKMLGMVLSVVYVSRNGLTEEEIWGLLGMSSHRQPSEPLKNKLFTFLKEYTMVVNNMHSFSHAIYKEVVYDMYISSHEALIRWHYTLARFFNHLPPCDRKLVALPYHLEVAGSWSRVKNCLTDIEMFQLWWTPKFKKDFLKIWCSLTMSQKNVAAPEASGAAQSVAAQSNDHSISSKHAAAPKQRPTYDIVEEYVKSLDIYRGLKNTKDDDVANIILQIADFLIEFATLGYERGADVPALIHPSVPSEDLRALGVPHVVIDDDGRSTLLYPKVFPRSSASEDLDEKAAAEAPMAIEDMPLCTTFFFHRWMWIQFPYIALGNCEQRYSDGIKAMKEATFDGPRGGKKLGEENLDTMKLSKKFPSAKEMRTSMSKSWTMESTKLPLLKFNRKAAKSVRRVPKLGAADDDLAGDKVAQRLSRLQEEISNNREEHDFLVHMKSSLNSRLAELKGQLEELKRADECSEEVDKRLTKTIAKDEEVQKKCNGIVSSHKNLERLMLMCERHPPNVPALITEVRLKVEQDTFLIAEIKKRLWEQKFEKQTHHSCYRQMKSLVKDGASMHNKLLEYRYDMKRGLTEQAEDDTRRLKTSNANASFTGRTPSSTAQTGKNSPMKKKQSKEESASDDSETKRFKNWQETWNMISSRTGITEPEIFFQRYNNGGALLDKIKNLQKGSEARLEFLKEETITVEHDLEATRFDVSVTSDGLSTKEKHKELGQKTLRLRRTKEKAESMELLLQNGLSGFIHISELVGIPPREEGAPAVDVIRDVEAVMEVLLEEQEKQHQIGQNMSSSTSAHGTSAPVLGTGGLGNDLIRAPELEAALQKFESSKNLTAKVQTVKDKMDITTANGYVAPDAEEDDDEDEGMWDRKFAKTQSQRTLRQELKKAARLQKAAV